MLYHQQRVKVGERERERERDIEIKGVVRRRGKGEEEI